VSVTEAVSDIQFQIYDLDLITNMSSDDAQMANSRSSRELLLAQTKTEILLILYDVLL
jgi:hypothetical protein